MLTQQTFRYENEASLVEGLIAAISTFTLEHQDKINELLAIGISIPGLVDPEKGIVSHVPNVKVDNLNLAAEVESRFNISRFVGNDIRALRLLNTILEQQLMRRTPLLSVSIMEPVQALWLMVISS